MYDFMNALGIVVPCVSLPLYPACTYQLRDADLVDAAVERAWWRSQRADRESTRGGHPEFLGSF